MASQLQSHRPAETGRTNEMSKDEKRVPRAQRGSSAPPRGDELIARNLKLVYDEIAAEPLPPELAALLSRLDERGEKPQ